MDVLEIMAASRDAKIWQQSGCGGGVESTMRGMGETEDILESQSQSKGDPLISRPTYKEIEF